MSLPVGACKLQALTIFDWPLTRVDISTSDNLQTLGIWLALGFKPRTSLMKTSALPLSAIQTACWWYYMEKLNMYWSLLFNSIYWTNFAILKYPLFHGNIFFNNKRKMTRAKDIPSSIPRNILKNFLKNNTFSCDYFALENKMMIHRGKHSLNSRRISIKRLECVQKIFLIFSQPFLKDIPKQMNIPRNIPLYLVFMNWNYYECRLDIPQVREHPHHFLKLKQRPWKVSSLLWKRMCVRLYYDSWWDLWRFVMAFFQWKKGHFYQKDNKLFEQLLAFIGRWGGTPWNNFFLLFRRIQFQTPMMMMTL